MSITIGDIVVWLIVGALAGTLVGMLVKRSKEGFGRMHNFGLGMVGAVLGGLLFELLRIDFGMDRISISLKDIVAATVGSFVVLGLLRWYRTRGAPKT